MSEARGLGAFSTVPDLSPSSSRLPTQTSAELINLRRVAEEIRRVADDIDPEPQERDDDFDRNLAADLDPYLLSKIANELLQGIEADLRSRHQWEEITKKAIEYLGLIYEEASGQVGSEGAISKVWHTLLLEACLQFWANAQAEFLPAEGPVKVRDDNIRKDAFVEQVQQAMRGIGDNGGPPLDDTVGALQSTMAQFATRDEKAEALETDFNHYLTVADRQYYRDFSQMLWALGPIGTQFRKVYYNPLRKMAVSEWVKAENLIVSNDAAHLATAGRVTERMRIRHAEVKRLEWMEWWIGDSSPAGMDTPTGVEEVIGQTEGIQPRAEYPADYRHEMYECYCELDLPGFEHKEDGEFTGLPLPYRVTLNKERRTIKEIRRNWRQEDENFQARQRYVMFGMIPGFGFYSLGFMHILQGTERALTALEREMIDAGMFGNFPGLLWKKGARPDTTQIRLAPAASAEINLGMADDIRKVVMPMPYKDISPQSMALAQKIEDNGRKLASIIEMPVGEGMANVPVGTIISMIEEGTKLQAAIHKGLHQSRTEELELLKELIAEEPELLTRFNRNPARQWATAEEFSDHDLVPSSDPNTPSHIHRVMRATAYAQLSQIFPDILNRPLALERILRIIRDPAPMEMIVPPQPGGQAGPPPQAITAQAKIQATQIQAQARQASDAITAQTQAADRASKERVAAIQEQTERMKDATQAQTDRSEIAGEQHTAALQHMADREKLAADQQNAQLDREHQQGLETQKQMAQGIAPPPRMF